MDEITRVIKELFWLLQNVNIAEEDYKVKIKKGKSFDSEDDGKKVSIR